MYGVKDANGVELEVGDNVRILVTIWEDDDPDRVGTMGKVDEIEEMRNPDDALILVAFEDGDAWKYFGSEVELVQ